MIDGETLTLSTSAVATIAATTTPIQVLLLSIAGHLYVCICMFVWSSFSEDWASTRGALVNPARGQLSPYANENFVSRVRFGRPVPCQPAHSPHPDLVAFTYGHPLPLPTTVSIRPSCAIGLVSNLSGHTIVLPMAFTTENRYRASSSQSSSTNGSFLFR